MAEEIYFSGQGQVYVATNYTSGTNAAGWRHLGNVPALRLTLETDVLEHKESVTGQRLPDLRLTRERRASVTLTLESFTKANLMMMLFGSTDSAAAGTATAEAFPTVAVGDKVALAHPLVNTVTTITNAAGTTPLVEDTDYTIEKVGGIVSILSTAITAQPYKATYTYYAEDIVPMFESAPVERFLRFSGINTANSNKPVVVELYRTIFDPVSSLDFINDELASFELSGSVLYDSTRDSDATLGGFGRIIQASA